MTDVDPTALLKAPMPARFEHLFAVLSGQGFLSKRGIGNEVPFFICPFQPEEAVEMARLQRQLINRLEQAGVGILEINLYDLAIELLRERGIWDQLLEVEANVSRAELRDCCKACSTPRRT